MKTHLTALVPALAALFATASALPAQEADPNLCQATVNETEVIVDRSLVDSEITRREALLAWPDKAINRWRGTLPTCNSAELISHLAGTVPAEEIDGYCLATSETGEYVLLPGPRNYRGLCRKTTCERVNATRDDAVAMTGSVARGVRDVATHPGTKAVTHGSGAMILSGTGASITTTLSTAGSTALTALTAPVALTAAAVTVVAVGGALYVCQD